MSPVISNPPAQVGGYWITDHGVMVEVLEVDDAGNAMVSDVSLPFDKPEPHRVMASKFTSMLWTYVDRLKAETT